jgi:hypothetical protein
MSWEPYQRARLAYEEKALKANFSHFEFHNRPANTFLLANWKNSKDNWYQIMITLTSGFPDECPSTYVRAFKWSPGENKLVPTSLVVENSGNSHTMHTWETDMPGWTKICTYRPVRWSADYSLAHIALKAQLWIEAYECHLETGLGLATFLRTMAEK